MFPQIMVLLALVDSLNGQTFSEVEIYSNPDLRQNGTPQFRKDYTYLVEEKAFYKIHFASATFQDAALRCRLEGSRLYIPYNESKLDTIDKIRSEKNLHSSILVGIHATFSKGDFFTLEGQPLNKLHYWTRDNMNFDNKGDDESCVVLTQDTRLLDVSCRSRFPYICYHKRDPKVHLRPCGPSNNGYEYYNATETCYKFHRVPRIYSRAFMACAAEGGKLANVDSPGEDKVLAAIYKLNPASSMTTAIWADCAFVGVLDWGERGQWLTTDGEPLSTTGWVWSCKEPNNSTPGEFCTGMYRSGKLNDLWCDRPSPFICEMKPNALVPRK